MVKKRGQRPEALAPLLSLSRKGKWLPNRDLAEKFQSKSGPWPLLLYPLSAFLFNSLPFKEDKEPSYVSAYNFKFKRTPGPSAEVDSDIWYGHQEAVPGAGRIPGLGPFSAHSTLTPQLGYQSIPEWRTVCTVVTLLKCLLLFLQMGNKKGSTLTGIQRL